MNPHVWLIIASCIIGIWSTLIAIYYVHMKERAIYKDLLKMLDDSTRMAEQIERISEIQATLKRQVTHLQNHIIDSGAIELRKGK